MQQLFRLLCPKVLPWTPRGELQMNSLAMFMLLADHLLSPELGLLSLLLLVNGTPKLRVLSVSASGSQHRTALPP